MPTRPISAQDDTDNQINKAGNVLEILFITEVKAHAAFGLYSKLNSLDGRSIFDAVYCELKSGTSRNGNIIVKSWCSVMF